MRNRKPAWWQLFMLAPLMLVLLAWEHVTPLPGVSDGIVDVGIVVLTFAAMLVWVVANGGALEWYYLDRDETDTSLKVTVYEPAANRKSNREATHGPVSGIARAYANDPCNEQSNREKEEEEWLRN